MLELQNSWNQTLTDYPKNKSLSLLFNACANQFNDQIAIYSGDEKLTYAELNNKANLVAANLRKKGVGPNTLVALFLDRSIDLVVAILAVIKAGGAYLPLDIYNSIDRNKAVLKDAQPILVLTNSNEYTTLTKLESATRKVSIESLYEKSVDSTIEIQEYSNLPTDLAYVMYTSGSTGVPKGCMITHQGVIRLVKNTNYISFKTNDSMAQIANPAFDAMTFEVWGALLNGISLTIIPRQTLLSIPLFAKTLHERKISIMFITVSLLNLVFKKEPGAFDNMRCLLFGGEKANFDIIKAIIERKEKLGLNNLSIINGYGPTECTTFAVALSVEPKHLIESKQIPIGKPIANTQAYVLDKKLNAVAAGDLGELYLGGDGLALGYLHDEQLTAERFIRSPWEPEKTIYKTGDLVYWLPEVGIVLVDRIDRQIKIRGFRIELCEVEDYISKYPHISQVAAMCETNCLGEKELIAYISFADNVNFNPDAFRDYVKTSLPNYMIPAKLIQVDSIPLTSNGKIDRHQLKNIHGKNILVDHVKNIPINQLEEKIIRVWRTLGVEHIDTTHNFFDCGVHSLMLAEACILLNEQIKHSDPISILDILNYPTVQKLAQHLLSKGHEQNYELEEAAFRANHKRKIMLPRRILDESR